MQWLSENWLQFGGVITAVVAACSAVAAITPTPADDKFFSKIYRIIDLLAINVGKAKDKSDK